MTKASSARNYVAERGARWTLLYALRKLPQRAIQWLDSRMIRIEKRRLITGTNTISSQYHGLEENRRTWDTWDWSDYGEQWTEDVRQFRGVDPKEWKDRLIRELIDEGVPEGSDVLEIGPGAGRWTEHLLPRSRRMILADISARCIAICIDRFGSDPRVEAHVLDDATLSFQADNSVDVIWSYDVFVHVNPHDTARYIEEAARVLRVGGSAIVHHSGTYANDQIAADGYRSNMTAELFADLAERNGLRVVEQDRELAHLPGDVISHLHKDPSSQQTKR
jgi:ubiquinone/menaquinone biosynthesis C-methylase UbiE